MTIPEDQQPDTLAIRLTPATPLKLHIIDSAGLPIPNATAAVDYWMQKPEGRSIRNFRITRLSNVHADVTWTEAPHDEITLDIAAAGCQGKRVAVMPGTPATITLFPQPLLRIHAVSADTGKPVTDFQSFLGTYASPKESPQWHSIQEVVRDVRTLHDGTTEFTDDQPAFAIAARATGSHYLPSGSPLLPLDGHDYDVTLPLTEGERLTGQLLDADGSPLPNTPVWLDTNFLDIYDAKLPMDAASIQRDPAHYATTDQDGNFSFPPKTGGYLLVVATNRGYALVHDKKFETTSTLTLAPWATVHGTISPARAGIPIQAETASYYGAIGPIPQYSATTDAVGHFTFTHVFAGEYRLTVNPDVNQNGIAEKTFKVRPGQSATISVTANPP